MSNKQNGFGAAQLLLLIVVVGMIGFIGWFVLRANNETSKIFRDTDSASSSTAGVKTSTSTGKETKTKMITGSLDKNLGVSIAFEYPETWKLNKTPLNTNNASMEQTATLTSPTGAIAVTYELNNYGLGGTCVPEEHGTLTQLKTTKVAGYSKVMYVETTANVDKVLNHLGLMASDKVNSASVGSSYCKLYLANVVTLNESNGLHMIASVNLAGNAESALDLEAYNTITTNVDYAEAKAILLSTVIQ